MKYSLGLPPVEELKADCSACQGMCCMAHKHHVSELFPISQDKPAGKPCEYLQYDAGFACGIYEQRQSRGFHICCNFDCLGAGQELSRFFEQNFGYKWSADPYMHDPAAHNNMTVNMRYAYNLLEYTFQHIVGFLQDVGPVRTQLVYELCADFFDELSEHLYSDTLSGKEFDPNYWAHSLKGVLFIIRRRFELLDLLEQGSLLDALTRIKEG